MNDEPTRRLFFALWPDARVRRRLAAASRPLLAAAKCRPIADSRLHVTLAFLEDCLKNYRKAGLGWALWNFDGSFGILDSGRKDVAYEDFHGHKLDRKMLDLLLPPSRAHRGVNGHVCRVASLRDGSSAA